MFPVTVGNQRFLSSDFEGMGYLVQLPESLLQAYNSLASGVFVNPVPQVVSSGGSQEVTGNVGVRLDNQVPDYTFSSRRRAAVLRLNSDVTGTRTFFIYESNGNLIEGPIEPAGREEVNNLYGTFNNTCRMVEHPSNMKGGTKLNVAWGGVSGLPDALGLEENFSPDYNAKTIFEDFLNTFNPGTNVIGAQTLFGIYRYGRFTFLRTPGSTVSGLITTPQIAFRSGYSGDVNSLGENSSNNRHGCLEVSCPNGSGFMLSYGTVGNFSPVSGGRLTFEGRFRREQVTSQYCSMGLRSLSSGIANRFLVNNAMGFEIDPSVSTNTLRAVYVANGVEKAASVAISSEDLRVKIIADPSFKKAYWFVNDSKVFELDISDYVESPSTLLTPALSCRNPNVSGAASTTSFDYFRVSKIVAR